MSQFGQEQPFVGPGAVRPLRPRWLESAGDGTPVYLMLVKYRCEGCRETQAQSDYDELAAKTHILEVL
jgi:hypothetical protein